MGSVPNNTPVPWTKTPTVYSPQLSAVAGCNIYMKLDNLQPSGSFKSRGIGNLMTRAAEAAGGRHVHFYCSSGGNAGLACATSALTLNRKATIVIPTATTPLMKRKLLTLGVEVYQVGKNWAAADKFLREELLSKDPAGVYVPPFDNPHIWDGAASIIDELREQMDVPIDAIVASIGGGGLVNGLMQGIESYPWSGRKPKVLGVETAGADSLNASIKAGRLVTLPEITSIATSLAVVRVSEETWRWSESPHFYNHVVSDADAAMSCVRFADDARQLIEVSCGATIATVYRGDLKRILGKGMSDSEWAGQNIVLEVCGGSSVSMGILEEYREIYAHEAAFKA